jgi:hypothetical protein
MTARIGVECEYYCSVNSIVDLPEGRSYKDIDSMYVKWGTIHIAWNDGSEWSRDMSETDDPNVDYKRPNETRVFTTVEGEIDWENDITDEVLS